MEPYDLCLSSDKQQKQVVKKLYSKLKNKHKINVKWLNQDETSDRRVLKSYLENSNLFLCCVR